MERPGTDDRLPIRPAAVPQRGERVVLGLSGGVDSAVAAFLLCEAGCEVVAVTTRNFCLGDEPFDAASAPRSCCSEEAIGAARDLAADLGLQHLVLDVADDFRSAVIDDYVQTYLDGRTPSPCVRCNTGVRFPRLLALASQLDARWVATGHYARRVLVEGGHFVARGTDRQKDQSYFLHRLADTVLARVHFPLGDRTKEEVRVLAQEHGLAVAQTPDSQELCFVPDGDRSRLLGRHSREGEIVDRQGRVLGRHPGIGFFTPGQRRGIGLGGGPVRYVVAVDASRDRVIVGSREDLQRRRLVVEEWLDRDPRPSAPGLRAQTRSRPGALAVEKIEWPSSEESVAVIDLADADRAPAPGQAVVLYREEIAVAGGILRSAAVGPSEELSASAQEERR